MKIAVTAEGPSLEASVDPRFGRCPYFVIVDPADMTFEAVANPFVDRQGGAGIQSAKMMADRGVEVVCTGNLGPNAVEALGAAGIRTVTGCSGQVRQVLDQFKTTSGGTPVAAATVPLVPSPQPQALGSGRGSGRGKGLGMRRGRGCGGGGGGGRGWAGGRSGPGQGMA